MIEITGDNPHININEIIEYIKNHLDELQQFTDIIFSDNSNKYSSQTAKSVIISAVLKDHKDFAKPFLISGLNCQSIPTSDYYYAFQISVLTNAIKSKNYLTYEDVSDIFESGVKKPYSMTANIFLYEIQKHLRPINPSLYTDLDNYLYELWKIIDSTGKACYVPNVIHKDSCNPRISKFGGVTPYLCSHGPKVCSCGSLMECCFSFYVPSLPEEVQKLFPPSHEYVVVGYTCNTCYEIQNVALFVDDEIDQIVYSDVPYDAFNEPRTVIGFDKQYSYPQSVSIDCKLFPEFEQYHQPDLYFLDQLLSKQCSQLKTYLLGYPIFIQGDDSPEGYTLFLEMEESEASTNLWGDCGTCQVWMSTGDEFGDFVMQYACS